MRTRSQTGNQKTSTKQITSCLPQLNSENKQSQQVTNKLDKGKKKAKEAKISQNEAKIQTSNKKPRKRQKIYNDIDSFVQDTANIDGQEIFLTNPKMEEENSNLPNNQNQSSSQNHDNDFNNKKISIQQIPNENQNLSQQNVKNPILIDLGELIQGTVIKRPSAQIRTPYVADVDVASAGNILAHSPSLDCAGMIVPNATVYMTKTIAKDGEKNSRKTSHSIRVAVEPREGEAPPALVGCHPQTAEHVVFQALQEKLLPELGNYEEIEREKTFRNTRVDFVLKYYNECDGDYISSSSGENQLDKLQNKVQDGDKNQIMLLEVKNVVCADYPEGGVPENRGKIGIYTSNKKPYERTAIFPHGAKKPKIKVVSDRAIKQVNDLILMQKEGIKCGVLFIVSRDDCVAFRACHEADMLLAQILLKAKEQGVLVLAHSVAWGLDGSCRWGRPLPLRFDESVRSEDIDYEHLEKVLEYNADQKNVRQPPKKKKKD